ncbi:MAG TPA: hypothetical protein VGV36_03625 [Solirubrobacteraceae bacterium]|nr:hypothetical protein [Solirubrobacteraceae bacterium]
MRIRAHAAQTIRGPLPAVLLTVLLLGAAACGGDDFANDPRPPIPLDVTALVTEDGISVSPAQFGAGVVRVIIANQTEEPQTLTLKRQDSDRLVVGRQTGSIGPGDTAELKADLDPGTYELLTEREDVQEATIKVTEQRPSGENVLLAP